MIETLTDEQEAITFESHVVFFTPDETVFARVPSRIEFQAAALDAGFTEDEAFKHVEKLTLLEEKEQRFPMTCYSSLTPPGRVAGIHKAACWPISEDTYNEAKRVVWNTELMEGPHLKEVLAAHEKWTAYEITRRAH